MSVRLPSSAAGRAQDWLRGSAPGLVVLALVVGAGSGVGAVVFRYLILVFTQLFTGSHDYSAAGRVANPNLPWLGLGFVVLAPVVGGLIYGPIVNRFAPEARGHGVPEVMLAIAERGGRIRPQVSVVKALASALCIGAGGSVGREGPIVQIGSALGSSLGQAARVPETRLRILVACGAAGGISATFNAPIAGVFFALELILADFAAESFGVVVLASVAAGVVGRAAFGGRPFLTLPPFHLVSGWEYGLYALLGGLAGIAGVSFIRVLYGLEDLADRLWRGPEALRPAVGGVLLGLLLLGLPQLYGVGYPVLESAVRGNIVVGLLVALLVGKVVATSLTIAIGGSGGVFAPSLFMGAMLGALLGSVAHGAFGGAVAPAGAYALVGMGAVFAAAARAPITAVLIIFELTGDYTIILPLMVAVVVAAGISNLLSKDTIYTLKLRRRGIDIERGRSANLMKVISVAEAMEPLPQPVSPLADLSELTARLLDERRDALPVVDLGGEYRGVVTSRRVEEAMGSNALDVTAESLMTAVTPIRATATLHDALADLVQQSRGGVPVIDDGRLAGWLTHRDALSAYQRRLQSSVDVASRPAVAPAGASGLPPIPRLSDFRIVDLTLGAGEPSGRRVREVGWPESSLLLAIQRDGVIIVPRGDTRLCSADRLTVLLPAGMELAAADLIADPAGPSSP
ncbi:MAG: chloride channel protein [Candidatus Dormibacteria bacterium]